MFPSLSYPSEGRSPKTVALFRWAGLLMLLLIEVTFITLRFDSGTLARDGRWWSELLGRSHHLPRLAIVMAIAMWLFGSDGWRGELRRILASIDVSGWSWIYLLGHLAAFAGFTALTALVLEGDFQTWPHPGLWVVAWGLMGLAVLVLLGAVAWPSGLWGLLTWRMACSAMVGLAIGFAAWAAGQFTHTLWGPLSQSTMWTVGRLLGLAGHEVVCQPERFIVGTPFFAVKIAPECSGYEGIGLILILLSSYLFIFRHYLNFPRAFLLLPLGTVIIWAANAVRIASFVALGTWGWHDVALQGFHSQAGWLAFNFVALGLIAVTRGTRLFARNGGPTSAAPVLNPTAAYLTPLLTIVAITMITAAFSSGFDYLYPLRVLAAAAAFGISWQAYAELRWSWSWGAIAVGIGVFALWMALEPLPTGPGARDPIAAGLSNLPRGWALTWLIFRVIGSVITVPLAEELAFRGYLTRRLVAADFQDVPAGQFSWPSFLISSGLFGMLHGRWLAGVLAGMLYAFVYYRRRQLTDAVVAHATTNALIAVYVVATRTWSLWS